MTDGPLTRTKLRNWLGTLSTSTPIHLDFETTGLDAHDPEQSVVVWGLADHDGRYCAFDDRTLTEDARDYLHEWLNQVDIVAFNSVFDGAWLARELRQWPRVVGCSYMLYRVLASEGHKGQAFSLEAAQEHVLGWPVYTQKAWLADALQRHKLPKSRMAELADLEPVEFAWYCAVDAVASALLWQYFEWRCLESEPEDSDLGAALRTAWNYHVGLQVPQLERVVWYQQFDGLRVDVPALQAHAEHLAARIDETKRTLGLHPLLKDHVQEIEAAWYEEWQRRGYRTKKIMARKKDEPWRHTDYWYLDTQRKPRATWEHEHGCWSHQETTWHEPSTKPEKFNWNSEAQVRDLLYHRVFRSYTDTRFVNVTVDGTTHQLELTDGGAEPVNKEVYGFFGDIGKLLLQLAKLQKELSYVEAYLTAAAKDSRMYIKLRPGATSNGRCAGG